MKKNLSNFIRINTEFSQNEAEELLLWRFKLAIQKGYQIPKHDFYLYCAILIKRNGLESLTEKFKKIIFHNNTLDKEVNFQLIRLKILDKTQINDGEKDFFYQLRKVKVNERKAIIKKQISKTTLKGKILNTINHKNSMDYKELLKLTYNFSDITVLDWFIPIVLKYERVIHIFVRHVEETKFAESTTINRTFFSYKSDEIWILLKILIKQEAENIKEHFIENSVNVVLEKPELMKPYHRNSLNPISWDKDLFALSIDKNGFIMKFHQI